jgi:hypothetical protein
MGKHFTEILIIKNKHNTSGEILRNNFYTYQLKLKDKLPKSKRINTTPLYYVIYGGIFMLFNYTLKNPSLIK